MGTHRIFSRGGQMGSWFSHFSPFLFFPLALKAERVWGRVKSRTPAPSLMGAGGAVPPKAFGAYSA